MNYFSNLLDVVSEKPNYEVGSKAKLTFGKKQPEAAKKVWKLDMDDDEMMDPDELLDEEDKKKPTEQSLRVCATTGKRKACKDWSCGLAEELDAASKGSAIADNPTQKSSCGSVSFRSLSDSDKNNQTLFQCYLGDAFRCSTCPYLGLPAFKPGEKIQLNDGLMKNDI